MAQEGFICNILFQKLLGFINTGDSITVVDNKFLILVLLFHFINFYLSYFLKPGVVSALVAIFGSFVAELLCQAENRGRCTVLHFKNFG
jgi:hypothetical protein